MARYTGPMTKKSRRLGVDLVGEDKAFEKHGSVLYFTVPSL